MISLRIRPEIYHVLKKYSDGNYQVAVRALITKYAKKLVLAKAEIEDRALELEVLESTDDLLNE